MLGPTLLNKKAQQNIFGMKFIKYTRQFSLKQINYIKLKNNLKRIYLKISNNT